MALGMVQPGYGNATCRYPAQLKNVPDISYEEVVCQLELALGLSPGEKEEEPVCEEGTEEQEEKPRTKTTTEEEWENLLEQLDVVEAVLQSALEQEYAETEQERLKPEEKERKKGEHNSSEFSEEAILTLVEESTWCTCNQKEEEEKEVSFLTWYTKKHIYCRKTGSSKKYEWKINLFDVEEYEKVLMLIGRFPENRNLVFAANQEFWLDFLDNDFDEEGFLAFFEGKQKDSDDYRWDVGNSEFLQSNAGRFAEYINPSIAGSAKKKYRHRICLTCEVDCNRKRRLK